MDDLQRRLGKAVQHFWRTRDRQAASQGKTGQKDAGLRTAVTGGKHLDGFIMLCRDLLMEAGLPEANLYWSNSLELPGYFRAEKSWDLLAVVDGHLLAILEFKAQVGPSFGNNFNNRTEEALGNATDLWAAYREGAFKPSGRPWLGYLFLLEECPRSLAPVRVKEPHFRVFEAFREASYAKRYEILLTRLLRERLYDGACLLLSTKGGGAKGEYREPNRELAFQNFANSLLAHAIAFAKTRQSS
ncbi:MAG: restriction endonuclease [Planctomycetes bacterium RBG_16_64_12]|nr:MAG: restriction endonuclease [Planctomycetes bacterium RBG_16_64_12]